MYRILSSLLLRGMWTYLKRIVKFYHLSPTTPKKWQNYMQSLQQPQTQWPHTYNRKKIVTKSSAWIVQTAIWPTAAKNWMSGHFLWTLICQVYFHTHRDLHSTCTDVRTTQMQKKILFKEMKSKCQNKTMDAHLWVTNINTVTYCNTVMKGKKIQRYLS